MNFVVALLLLIASEEEAFWMLCCIVEDVLPHEFYGVSMIGASVELELLSILVERNLENVHSFLTNNSIIPTSFTAP